MFLQSCSSDPESLSLRSACERDRFELRRTKSRYSSSSSGLISSRDLMSIVDFRLLALIISLVKTRREKIPSWIERARDQRSILADTVRLVAPEPLLFFADLRNFICSWDWLTGSGMDMPETCILMEPERVLSRRSDFETSAGSLFLLIIE